MTYGTLARGGFITARNSLLHEGAKEVCLRVNREGHGWQHEEASAQETRGAATKGGRQPSEDGPNTDQQSPAMAFRTKIS